MVKKFLLDLPPEPSLYTMLGISCHLMDYRLSYLINQQMEFHLEKKDDLITRSFKTKNEARFSFYQFRDEDNFNLFVLLANRSEEFILIPEVKQVDFIMIIEGEIKKTRKDQIMKELRKIPNVLTSFEIKPGIIKNGENFFSDVEMHLTYLNRMEKIANSAFSIGSAKYNCKAVGV